MPRLERVVFNNNDDGVGGGGDDIFVYTGGEQRVPRGVKRVRIAENVDTILDGAFRDCEQLIEVEGHNRLQKIENCAFLRCICLRRVMNMTGVVEIEEYAFFGCSALSDSELELDRVEIIGEGAFIACNSLRSINMPSIRKVCYGAFQRCEALTDAVFDKDLERIEGGIFWGCTALRRITIPLKDGLVIENHNTFKKCENLVSVDALAGEIHKTISSLHMKSWRDEMEEEIDRINQTLLNTPGIQKATAIQEWITRVFQRIEHYKNEHQALVKEAMTLLELALWKANLHDDVANEVAAAHEGVRVTRGRVKRARKDRCITSGASIVIKNVLPFLALM